MSVKISLSSSNEDSVYSGYGHHESISKKQKNLRERRCAFVGCITRLSDSNLINKKKYCFIHQGLEQLSKAEIKYLEDEERKKLAKRKKESKWKYLKK